MSCITSVDGTLDLTLVVDMIGQFTSKVAILLVVVS